MENRVLVPHFSGVPSFFRACCQDGMLSGSFGYDSAGRELARHLCKLIPIELDYAEWVHEIECLRPHVEASNGKEVLRWFFARFPRCMAFVPKRRRGSFLRGAYMSLRPLFEIDEELQK